jgi:hypothetical protein
MQIRFDFDVANLTSQRQREVDNLPLVFPIWIEHENVSYPSEDWWDFGVVILDWWSGHLLDLLQHARVRRFLFMNGPYEVQVRHRRATRMMELRPLGLESAWEASPSELVNVLINALQATRQELERSDVGKRDQELIQHLLSQLEKYQLHAEC